MSGAPKRPRRRPDAKGTAAVRAWLAHALPGVAGCPFSPAEIDAAAAIDLFGRCVDEAVPPPGSSPRLSFVAAGDNGARDRGLFRSDAILVVPCDHFRGAGLYQIAIEGTLAVRFVFRINQESVRVRRLDRDGTATFADLTPDLFEDVVCGLVVASLNVVCRPIAAELHRQRERHS